MIRAAIVPLSTLQQGRLVSCLSSAAGQLTWGDRVVS